MKSIALKAGLTILLLLILLPLTLILSMKILSHRFPDREIDFIEKIEIGAMDQWISQVVHKQKKKTRHLND